MAAKREALYVILGNYVSDGSPPPALLDARQ